MKKLSAIITLMISIILLLVGYMINSCNIILIANFMLIIHNIIYSIEKIDRRITFLMFNISFFTLLIGKN